MIQSVNVLLASVAALWLSACGGGGGGAKEEATEDAATPSNTDATGTTTAASTVIKPSGNVAKGENNQVEVKNTTSDTQVSLTLTRLGDNKLTWNEVVKAGASYLVFERTETTAYDFTSPLQSLEDVVSLVLSEKPGTHCYIIRAKTKDNKITVDSNEICVKSSAALVFNPLSAASLVASETFTATLQATAGDTAVVFSCVAHCPDGLNLDKSSGLLSWTPRLDQAGDHTFTVKAEAGKQSLEQSITVSVLAAFVNLTLSSEGQLLGEETVTVRALAASNLQGTPAMSIQQLAGPTVSLGGTAGAWTFNSPNIRNPTDFTFEVSASLGGVTRKATTTLSVLARDHGPALQDFTSHSVIASESISIASVASDPDLDTLSFACVLNCPRGLLVNASTGAISWQPDLDQVGEAHPTIRVTANGQSVSASLSLLVLAPVLNLNLIPIAAVSGETVLVKPQIDSNLKAPYQFVLTQTSGPRVAMLGTAGNWSFVAPAVTDRTTLGFDLKSGNGIYMKQENLSIQIDPSPVAPSVDVGRNLLSRSAVTVQATVSSNAKTLAWSLLSGPGHVSFSAADQSMTSIAADTDGIYVIALDATNSSHQTGRATFQLTWDTSAPQIEAGADATSGTALLRTATVLGAKTLNWSKVSGPGPLHFSTESLATTTITADQDGDYVIQLSAEDEAGNVSHDSFTWHYDHTPPTVDLGAPVLLSVKTKVLTAVMGDDAVSIKWKKVSGPSTVVFAPDNARTTSVTLGGDGIYIIEASVADALGNRATAQLQLTVDTLPPTITGITLGSVVADGFLNSFEKLQSLPLINSVAVSDSSGYTLGYKIVGSTSTCTSSLVYATTVPKSDDATIAKAGTFKVCVKATDSINLSAYLASANFVYDATVIAVTVSSLPADPSRTTDLAALVAGKNISHYRSKIGRVESTNCASIADYSSESPIATTLSKSYAELADGAVRLCVIGRTAAGNWQDPSVAYRYDWNLDRAVPNDPANLNVMALVERVRLFWEATKNADSYLVVRAEEKSVTWLPTSGQVYNVGDDIDGGTHQIVAVTSSLQAFDETAQGTRNYHYALFSFDKALNYNTNASRATAAPIQALEYNKANGFDRLVRVILPIHTGEHKGKILVGGDFLVYQKDPAVRLLRLNADFTLDTSFKPALINGSVYSLALGDDGSIYVGGSFTTVGGKARVRLTRLTSSGALDESFIPSGFNNTVMALSLNNDESRLYVGGSFTATATAPTVVMNRLAALRTVDGALDSSFVQAASADGSKIGFNNTVWTILPDPSSSEILVGGAFTDYGGSTLARIVKLDDTGAIDSSISLGAGFNSTVVTLKMDSKQRIYAGGSFSSYRGSSYYARLVRLKPDGLPDTDFNKGVSTAARFNSTVYAIELDEANNKVYASGDFTLYGTAVLTRLARLSMSDGSLDTSFAGGTNGSLQALALTDDGNLLGGGSFQRYVGSSTSFFFAAVASKGALHDKSPQGAAFNSNVFATVRVFGDLKDPNGTVKHFLGGTFTTYNGDTANRVVKLDRLGNIDKAFNSQVTNGSVYAMAWDDADKKLYVAGTFTQVNAVARLRIARLNADGSLDTAFAPEGFDSDVYALALATLPGAGTRVLYVGGKFTKNGTTAVGRMVRLTTDGKLDNNFALGSGFDSNVNALQVVNTNDDHTVYVGGSFTKLNSSVANAPRLVKLASDGNLANGFEPGAGFNGSVQALVWVPGEAALYVGGAFTRYQTSLVANRIAKIDATGGFYTGFNGTGFNSTVYALDYDGDNDLIWVGGAFTTFRSIAQGRMAAMGRDGSRIAAYNAAVGFNSDVRAIASSFWGVVAAGLGSSYEGDVCGFAARLHVNATMD